MHVRYWDTRRLTSATLLSRPLRATHRPKGSQSKLSLWLRSTGPKPDVSLVFFQLSWTKFRRTGLERGYTGQMVYQRKKKSSRRVSFTLRKVAFTESFEAAWRANLRGRCLSFSWSSFCASELYTWARSLVSFPFLTRFSLNIVPGKAFCTERLHSEQSASVKASRQRKRRGDAIEWLSWKFWVSCAISGSFVWKRVYW